MKYLKDLQKLVEINSYTQNAEGVNKVSSLFTLWLEDIGFSTTVYNRELIGDHHLYTTPRIKNKKNILLLGHNDTVFPKGYFENFTQDEDYIYGPGVCDMKGGNIVALEALRNIFKQNNKITNIDFLLVGDEETGSDDSSFVTSKIAQNYDCCFVFEAAGKNLELVSARKGVAKCIVHIKGKAAHAGTSYAEGIDANLEAAYKIKKFIEVSDLEKGSVVNVGKIEGGIGLNTVSPSAVLQMEFRFTSHSEKERIIKEIEDITNFSHVKGTKATLDLIIQRDVMEENEKQFKLITELEEIIGKKIITEKRGGVSDANVVSAKGVATLDGFGPFGDGDHTKEERALKSSFTQRIDMVTKIFDFYQK